MMEDEAVLPAVTMTDQAEPMGDSVRVINPFEDAAAQYAAQYDDGEPETADEGAIIETATFANTAVLEVPLFAEEPLGVSTSADPAQELGESVNSIEIVQAAEEPPQTFFGWVWASMMGRGYSQAMLQDLNAALVDEPDMLTNLVLRGEIYLKRRDYAAAQVDFKRALAVGERQLHQARWGIVPQVMMDRAIAGLHEAQRA